MYIEQTLYDQILAMMPIPCVDVAVLDMDGRILLLRRTNEPAAGRWWFPGGRVFFGETREDAVRRKLRDECGLIANQFQERGSYDLFFNIHLDVHVHSITTLFIAQVDSVRALQLDDQSAEALWLRPREWLEYELSPFVRDFILTCISNTDIAHSK